MSVGSSQPAEAPQCDILRRTYAPVQIALAYDWPAIGDTNFGAGVTIAIASAASPDFSTFDPVYFWNHYGLPQHSLTLITVATDNSTVGNVETTLDAEWAGVMAPGADLLAYVGKDTVMGLYDVYSEIVNENQAQIMTISWSHAEYPGDRTLHHPLFEQAAAQGITVVVAVGDTGGEPVQYPSTDPLVVAAGGTRLLLNEDNSIFSEMVWNDDWGATGGGISTVFSEPSWQYGPGVPQNGWRNSSDLSLDADECTGYHLYYHGFQDPWDRFGGGTSFVAPELAALFADFISLTNGQTLGQVNPAFYADARAHYSTDFHDITVGNNNFNGTGGYSAGTGWDHPSGWGTPDAAQLLGHLEGGIALSLPWIFVVRFNGCFNVSLGDG